MPDIISSEEAVSEVVDFVTIMGILVISIGLIGVAGYPMLESAQETNHIENTRQSFAVLAENLNKVALGQTPSQSVELKMYGDELTVVPSSDRSSTINITVYNGTYNTSYIYDMGAVEARFDTTSIGYENTGAWINYTTNTRMISRPDIIISDNNVYIPVIKIGKSDSGSSSVGGSGLVRVVARETWNELLHIPDVRSIRITVNSSYAEGWQKRFLNETMWFVSSETTMVRSFDPAANVYIQQKTMDVGIQ